MIVVPDAGPLIYLGGASQLDLLRRLYTDVVPRVVFDEGTLAGRDRTGAAEVRAATWLIIEAEAPDPESLATLDPGEAAAIPLASRLGATLRVDDGAGRAAARDRGLVVVGTLGVLLTAKRRGLLPEVMPVLERMTRLGMFASAALVAEVRRLAGEENR